MSVGAPLAQTSAPPVAPPEPHRAWRAKIRLPALILLNILGLGAYLWPFILHPKGMTQPHGGDWILILLVLLGCLGALLFSELGRGGLGPKAVALIGIFSAVVVALRLPGFISGFSASFIIVLVAGNSFGPSFGFTLGAVGIFASDLFIGLGPWTPFVMVAMGWVGAGAGMLPKGSWPLRIGSLALYGFIVGFVFGMLTNLWSWPFLTQGSGISWVPGATTAENLQHYATFYVATSLGWDAFRAVGNTILVLVLGRPLLGALDRAAKRMRLDVKPEIL